MKTPRLLAPLVKALGFGGSEGSQRGPFFGVGELGGLYGLGPLEDGWQRNLEVSAYAARHIPAVYACVMASARAVSSCYPQHKILLANSGEEVSKTSPAYRFFRKPNSYQTWPQFILGVIAAMLFDGEAFCQIVRDQRNVVIAMHLLPRGNCSPVVAEDGSVFYSVGANPMVPDKGSYVAPAREIVHFRQHTPRHPLIGESPVKAAALSCGINVALSQTQAAFFRNMNRPSGVLTTDQTLTAAQMVQLREAFDKQSALWAKGGLPILSSGLSFVPLSVNSVDAQLIESQRMSIADIARVYGTPLAIIGEMGGATFNNTEALINHWLAISLGALLENVERSLDDALGLQDAEFCELDTTALLRLDYSGRIDALTRATQGGLMAPNEARAREGLAAVEGGDQPFMQAQNTPVNLLAELAAANIEAKKAPPPAPVDGANPPPVSGQLNDPPPAKSFDPEVAKAFVENMIHSKRAA
jgi:HK97 family phage portal protein